MAKKASQKVTVTLTPEQELLKAIGAGSVTHVAKTPEAESLVNQGLAEVNPQVVDGEGKVAIRLTQSGTEVYNKMNTPAATVTAPAVSNANAPTAFAIIGPNAGFVKPERKRGNPFGGAGAPPKYPFADLDIGGSFFVPVSPDMPDPVKTMSSAASQANIRFSEETGEFQTKERIKRGKGNKPLIDAAGKPIKETVKVPVRRPRRKFSVTPIKANVAYGSWSQPVDGAMVTRVPLD